MVVRVYTEVKEFILSCVKFSEDLNLSQVSGMTLILTTLGPNGTQHEHAECCYAESCGAFRSESLSKKNMLRQNKLVFKAIRV
jgi:hypothetical protein